jgi:hypothetical protein
VQPGSYSVTEGTLTAGWQLTAASCLRGAASTGTKSGSQVSGVSVSIGETTVCTFTNGIGAPTVTVTKTADPTQIPETGGNVTFSVSVTNTFSQPVTLSTLVDNVYGNLVGQGTCAVGSSIAAGASYSCSFTKTLSASTAGAVHRDTITATVTNPGGSGSNKDDAVVTYSDVAPTITVLKSPNVNTVPETGGPVTYSVSVTNNAAEAVTLNALTDDKFGNLNGQGTCVTGSSIAAGGTYICSFTRTLAAQNAGTFHTNVVTATAQDNDATSASDTDDAQVGFSDVAPTLDVTKTADVSTVPETGGSVTYTVTVTNTSAESVTLTALSDDKFGALNGQGTCATGGSIAAGGSSSCTFTKSVSGNVGTTHTNVVSATVQDNDGTSATDTDDASVGFSNVAPTVTVEKTPTPASLPETGGSVSYAVSVTNHAAEAVTLTTLSDNVFGNLNGQGTCATGGSIAAGGTYNCSFSKSLSAQNAGTSHTNVVSATVRDEESSSASDTDDAVVSFVDVAPTITVVKSANVATVPETGGSVTYTVSVTNNAAEAVTLTALSDNRFGNLNGQGTCATGGSIGAGATLNCSFTKSLAGQEPGTFHVNTVSATAQDNDGSSASDSDDASVGFTNVAPSVTVLKTPGVNSVPETGGPVTYAVAVTNNSAEAVTLTTLTDNRFGNLHNQGTCATGGTIAAGGTYNCSFTKSLSAQNAGTNHTNVVTAVVTDNDASTASDTDDAVVAFSDVAPTITVQKSASPTTVPETGGQATYTVTVTNNAAEAVTLTTLSDDKFGNLNGKGSCATGGTIAAGATYSCSFTMTLAPQNAGTSHTNVVTALVTDNDGSTGTDNDQASVGFSNVAPTITVLKTPTPASLPETGGSVSYAIQVTNNAQESVTLTTLSDDKFGNLNGEGSCDTNEVIAAGATYNCSFSRTLAQNAGTQHTNVVTANAVDNDNTSASDTDDAVVSFTDVGPTVTVLKTPTPASLPETGGSVSYAVAVTNNSAEAVTLTALTDDKFGNLNGQGTCATGGNIAAGGTYNCSFSKSLAQNKGTSHTNVVTSTVRDNDGTDGTDTDDATVTFTDVLPNISVTKTANPTTLGSAASGLPGFTADRTFTGGGSTPGGGFQFASATCDDAGANDVPAQTDLNCFNRADNIADSIAVQWTWDDTNVWGGTGQTGDACSLLDIDNDGNANVAVCARITNSADLTQVLQVPGAGASDVYQCNDTRPDRCANNWTQLQNILGTTCSISMAPEGIQGGDDGADVRASCIIDLDMAPLIGANEIELLNVCSFPSGSPNSNPFDCVVRAGAGFIQIVKTASPTTTTLFGFTLSPASTDGTKDYAVQGGVTTALIPVTPGSNYSLTEILPANWTLQGASCTVDGGSTGSYSAAQKRVSNILVKTGQTTVCTFNNDGHISGNVTYTVVVTNNGGESVTLDQLTDDKFGNLAGTGNCATGSTIAANGGTFTCTFTKTLTGVPGDVHKNTVTAVAKDNDGNSDTETDDATVTFLGGS